MAVVNKWLTGTIATLMSAELNSLASSAGPSAGAIASAAFNNAAGGGGGDGYMYGELELRIAAPAGTLTAGTSAYVWFLLQPDGTNYEDGGSSVIPARQADVLIPLANLATAQRVTVRGVELPPGSFKALLAHNTGQAWAASGNTLKLLPYTIQGV